MLRYSTIILFLLVIVIFSMLSPGFFTLSNFINILVQSSSLTILAIGMTFVLLTSGIDLSVGSIMFFTGIISAKLVIGGVPIWWTLPIALLIGLAYGMINSIFIVRLKLIPFIVTLATFYAGRGLGLFISQTRAINLPESFLAIGSIKIAGIPGPVLYMLVVLGIAHYLLTFTPYGKHIYAVGHDQLKAKKAGIKVDNVLISVYLICGLCATLSGLVALGQLGAVSPTFGYQNEFMAIAAAVLGGTSLFGGKGHVLPGTLVGALLIQTIQNGLVIINADPYAYSVITGLVIFMIVMVDSLRHKHSIKSLRTRIIP